MEYIRQTFTENVIKKLFSIAVLIGLLLLLKPFKNMLLLTFIFTFLLSTGQNFIYNKIRKRFNVNKQIIAVVLFLFTIGAFVFAISSYVPKLTHELVQIKSDVIAFVNSNSNNIIVEEALGKVRELDYVNYIKENSGTAFKALEKVQEVAVAFVLSLILSLFFILEENKLREIGEKVANSKLKFMYNYYKDLGKKFVNSFGMIIKVQVIMAMINGILSFIGLLILGFPQTLALGFMIFILSFIPVLGVTLSLIPLCIVALKIGGIHKVIAVLVLIAIVHALESYVISPKLMAHSSHLPVFIIFLTLILAEHFLGMWGLIIGVPLLMFFMEVLEVK